MTRSIVAVRRICNSAPRQVRNTPPPPSNAASLQITEAATEGEICQFVMQSCKTFEQVLHDKVKEKCLTSRGPRDEGDVSTVVSTAEPMDAQLAPESSAHFIATLIRERKEGTAGDGMLDTMMGLIKQYPHQFQRLEQAADR